MKFRLKDSLLPVLIVTATLAACTTPAPVEGTRVALLPIAPAPTAALVEPTASPTPPPTETRPAATPAPTVKVKPTAAVTATEVVSQEQAIIWDKAETTVGKISGTVAFGMDNSPAIINIFNKYDATKNGFAFNTENNPDSINQVLKIFIGMGWQAWNNQHPEKQITAEEFAANPKDYQSLFKLRGQEELTPLNFANIHEFVYQKTTGTGGKTYLSTPIAADTSSGLEYIETMDNAGNKKGKLILYTNYLMGSDTSSILKNPEKYSLSENQVKYLAWGAVGTVGTDAATMSMSANLTLDPKMLRTAKESMADNSMTQIFNWAEVPPPLAMVGFILTR